MKQKKIESEKTDLNGNRREKILPGTVLRKAKEDTNMGKTWEMWRYKREEQSKLNEKNEIVK